MRRHPHSPLKLEVTSCVVRSASEWVSEWTRVFQLTASVARRRANRCWQVFNEFPNVRECDAWSVNDKRWREAQQAADADTRHAGKFLQKE